MFEAILQDLALYEQSRWSKHGGGREWCYSAYSGKKRGRCSIVFGSPKGTECFLPNEVVGQLAS